MSDTRKKDKEREWADVHEERKYVIEGGKIQCTYCSTPIADIKVTSNTISLQGKYHATTADKDGKVNTDFQGQCLHPSQQKPFCPPPPCKAVIQLGEWKDFSETIIQDDNAILVQSTIPCMISGEDLTIVNSGQIEVLTELEPMKKKILDAYWMDDSSDKKHRIEYPDYPVTLYLKTMGYKEGDTATVKVKSKEGRIFEGGLEELTVNGTVDEEGLVMIDDFKITYEKGE